jgi:predicted metal-dependent phosphoesterase TrpH
MHTTASDGRLTPVELVARATAAGLTTISVTDHDTVASIAEVTAAAAASKMRVVPGIEITAVEDGRDVHMLGYFFDPESAGLAALLVKQRELRVTRLREIAERLSAAQVFVDVEHLIGEAAARPGSSVGRPQVAREMVRAGIVSSIQEAFDVWLANGRPGFVPRSGPGAASVVDAIHDAGGVASMAHPGVTRRDDLIAPLAARGMDALEVYHSDHSPEVTTAYRLMARRLGILISGGSDFHGDDVSGRPLRPQRSIFGAITLPPPDFAALEARARA